MICEHLLINDDLSPARGLLGSRTMFAVYSIWVSEDSNDKGKMAMRFEVIVIDMSSIC